MNPSVTRCCDVSKAYPSMQPFFEYFIRLEKKKKTSAFNQGACAWSINSVALKEKSYLFTLQTQILKLCVSPTGSIILSVYE